jgi:hypothetical protein
MSVFMPAPCCFCYYSLEYNLKSGIVILPVLHYFEHMIKTGAHKGGVRIGKTPKKLASLCYLFFVVCFM